jgi:hypothetical protein
VALAAAVFLQPCVEDPEFWFDHIVVIITPRVTRNAACRRLRTRLALPVVHREDDDASRAVEDEIRIGAAVGIAFQPVHVAVVVRG